MNLQIWDIEWKLPGTGVLFTFFLFWNKRKKKGTKQKKNSNIPSGERKIWSAFKVINWRNLKRINLKSLFLFLPAGSYVLCPCIFRFFSSPFFLILVPNRPVWFYTMKLVGIFGFGCFFSDHHDLKQL